MTIDDMRYMLKIAEYGSITKAAQALYITQPSLSQRLSKVENELGIRLFERNRFGEVTLTEAGRMYCYECRDILKHWKRLQDHLETLKTHQNVSIGIPVRTGAEVVAGLMSSLSEVRPSVSLTYVDRANYQMEDMIMRGDLDYAIIRMPSSSITCKKRLLQAKLPAVHLRKDSPLWTKIYYKENNPNPFIALDDLKDEPLVAAPLTKEHRNRQWLEVLFEQIPGLHPNVIFTVPNINMYEQFIKNGTASYILAIDENNDRVCQLEPEYALPYETYFLQSDQADPELADIIYSLLCDLQNRK